MSCPYQGKLSSTLNHIRVEKARIFVSGHEDNINVRNKGREQTKLKPVYDHSLIVRWQSRFYNKNIGL